MSPDAASNIARIEGQRIVLPGIATVHSHAFQRGIRSRTQRRNAQGSFWSWRALMYQFAERLDPETIYALSRFAYAELAQCGVTGVGEFHYIWHQPDGTPYADRTTMADAVIRAARDVGLRITLLRVLYERAGVGKDPEGAQQRFCDDPDRALEDAETLAARYASDECVKIGVAPHSVRAVTADGLQAAAQFCQTRGMPLHMHVAEQRREIDECLAEHGKRPVELLEALGVLGPQFVAVHATHLEAHEAKALSGSFACICRTTERDLGDGLPDVSALLHGGATLCVGVDSHAMSDPFEELRAVELDERSRTEARTVIADGTVLLRAATEDGYAAIGQESSDDRVELDLHDASLAGHSNLDDAVVFGASSRAVRQVVVDGRTVVDKGVVPEMACIREAFETSVTRCTG